MRRHIFGVEVITVHEERREYQDRLAKAIQAGEKDLIVDLWEEMLPYVKFVAWKWIKVWKESQPSLEKEALIHAGYIAMLRTLELWDPTKGFHFSGWLSNELKSAFSAEVGNDTAQHRFDNPGMSLDVPMETSATDGDATLGDTIEDPTDEIAGVEEEIHRQQLHQMLDEAMEELPASQRETLCLRYYDGFSIPECSKKLGLSDAEIQAVERRALQAMRHGSHAGRLKQAWYGDLNLYVGTGYHAFQSTGSSLQERLVMARDERAQRNTNKDWLSSYMDELGLNV